MIDFAPSAVWYVVVNPPIMSSSALPLLPIFLPISFLSKDALLLITIFLDDKPWITSFADWLPRSDINEEVITDAADEVFVGEIPTLISDTFPVVCVMDSFGVVASTEEEVPGYGGGGGNLSEKATTGISIV